MARYLKRLWGDDPSMDAQLRSRETTESEDIYWNPYQRPDSPRERPVDVVLPSRKPSPQPKQNVQSQIPARVWIVKYLKDSIQGLVSQEAATGLSHSQMVRPSQPPQGSPYQMVYDEAGKPKKLALDEKNHHVRNICLAVEQCCFHSLQLKEFRGMLPFWSLVEHVAESTEDSKALQEAIDEICKHVALSTPVGKARGLLRYGMETGKIEPLIAQLLSNQALLRHFYYPDALLLCPEGTSILLSLVASLETFVFKFDYGCTDMNQAPEWPLLEELTLQLTASTSPPPPARRLSWTEDDIPAFESVVFDIDRKLSSLVISSNQASNKLMLALSWELNQGSPPLVSTSGVPSPFKRKGFFGVPLLDLLADVKRCQHAHLDPALGVPRAAVAILEALEEKVFTPTGLLPGLFFKEADPLQLSRLVKLLESSQAVPTDMDPHSLAAALLLFLHKLPEPLLTYERYDAFVDCQRIEEDHARRRNIRLLVEELPWWHKPLLLRVMDFLHKCSTFAQVTQPSLRQRTRTLSGSLSDDERAPLSDDHLGAIFTPALLRSYEPLSVLTDAQRHGQTDADHATYTIVRTLISDYDYVLRGVAREQKARRKKLIGKVERLKELNEKFRTRLSVVNPEHLHLLKVLWTRCERAEALFGQLPTVPEESDAPDSSRTIRDSDALWSACREVTKGCVEAGAGFPAEVPDSEPGRGKQFQAVDLAKGKGSPAKLQTKSSSLSEIDFESADSNTQLGSPWVSIHLHAGARAERSRSHSGDTHRQKSPLQNINIPWPDFSLETVSPLGSGSGRRRKSWAGHIAERSLSDFGLFEEQQDLLPIQERPSGSESFLKRVSSLDLTDTGIDEFESIPTLEFKGFSLGHKRWTSLSINPIADFLSTGILTIECMNYFLGRFPEPASKMIAFRALEGAMSFSIISGHVNRLLADILMIATPNAKEKILLTEISNKPFWKILDDPMAYMELFCMLLMLFDIISSTALTADFAECLSKARKILLGALTTWPLTIDELWQLWMTLAIQSEKGLYYHHDYLKEKEEKEHYIRSRTSSEIKDQAIENAHTAKKEDKITSGVGENGLIWKKVGPYLTHLKSQSKILTAPAVLDLETALPPANQACSWELVFSIAEHGANLFTLLQLCEGVFPSLLIVKDQKGNVFGALADEPWRKKGEQYFGSAGTFVFHLGSKTTKTQSYRWSGKNRYFMLCNDTGLGIGGGGHFALYLDSDLYHGSTGYCTTFESPALSAGEPAGSNVSNTQNFTCHELEVWAILPANAESYASRPKDSAHSFAK